MATCYVCQKPKASLVCAGCNEDLCKNCAQFLDEDNFAFVSHKPSLLSETTFCGPCYDSKIAPELTKYEDMLAKAAQVSVFLNNQGKETRNFPRKEDPVKVESCPDREETLLRLAFMAVEKGYNGLIDVDITSKKVRDGSYQKQIWSGSGIPAQINSQKKGWI